MHQPGFNGEKDFFSSREGGEDLDVWWEVRING